VPRGAAPVSRCPAFGPPQVYRATRANETFAIKILQRAKGSPPLVRKGCSDSAVSHGGKPPPRRPLTRPGVGPAPAVSRGLSHGRAEQVADLEREIAVMQRLDHPNITRLFEVIDDSMAAQVRERPNGGTLRIGSKIITGC
jgi:serine/threonine protein kinase